MKKILFSGSSDPCTAKQLAKKAKIKLGKVLIQNFACGEKYIQLLDDVRGKIVYLYQTSSFGPVEYLLELFLRAIVAKEIGAKRLI